MKSYQIIDEIENYLTLYILQGGPVSEKMLEQTLRLLKLEEWSFKELSILQNELLVLRDRLRGLHRQKKSPDDSKTD